MDDSKILRGMKEWPMVKPSGGKLVRIRTGPHSFILMDEEEAVRRGLAPRPTEEPEEKLERSPKRNKLLRRKANKEE